MKFTDEQYNDFMRLAREQFTPFRPIQLVELFKGRSETVRRIVNELQSPGRHIILYGDRGVGKTSLANLIPFFGHFRIDDAIIHRCNKSTTFDTICADVLRKLGITHVPISRTVVHEGSVDVNLQMLTIALGTSQTEELKSLEGFLFSPNVVAEHLEGKSKLIILDEFDRIDNVATGVAVADLIKQLSDSGAATRIVIVGVADSVEHLIGSHASIARSLAQVQLQRMLPSELKLILTDGFAALGLAFSESLIDSIVNTADGFPHFAHLLGLNLAEVVADRLYDAGGGRGITTKDYADALVRAIEGAQESLRIQYRKATETVRKKSDGYVQVLEGMAIADKTEVQINELLGNINALFGTEFKQQNISNWLGVLVNDRAVLLRQRVGFYKFADPMMRSYVRMIMGEKQLVGDTKYQQVFPFMFNDSEP